MTMQDTRERMIATQAAVMRALVSNATTEVANVSSEQIARTRQVLLNKRRAILKRTHPFLPAILGEQFCCCFDQYTKECTGKTISNPRTEAREFAMWLIKSTSVKAALKPKLIIWLLRQSIYCA